MDDKALALRDHTPIVTQHLSPRDLQIRINAIQEAMRDIMINDVHYGVIPGCGDKPALLKPGAELLCSMFRFCPKVQITREDLSNGHREITATVTILAHDGSLIAEGVGSCSTMESKYRWRRQEKRCPKCGKEAIKSSKFDDKGWYCYNKIGGCGAKFKADDATIVNQPEGKIENPDIADTYNTVLKMAKKRAQVDATLTATACSDMFTQDIEELAEVGEPAPIIIDNAKVLTENKRKRQMAPMQGVESVLHKEVAEEKEKQIQDMVFAFEELGVNHHQIDKLFKKSVFDFDDENMTNARRIYGEIKSGKSKPQDYFDEVCIEHSSRSHGAS